MKEDEEFEMLLGEIPHATSLNLHHLHHQQNHQLNVHGDHRRGGSSPAQTIAMYGMYEDDPSCHYKYMSVSPVNRVSLQSEGSSSSSASGGGVGGGGGSSSDDGSPTPSPFEESKSQSLPRDTHNPSGFLLQSKSNFQMGKNTNEILMNELGLSESIRRMHIRDELDDSSISRQFQRDPYGFQFSNGSLVSTNHGNVERSAIPFENCSKCFPDYRGLQSDGMKLALPAGLRQEYQMGNLLASYLPPGSSGALYSHPGPLTDPMNFSWQKTREHLSNETLSNLQLQADSAFNRNCYHRGIQVPNVALSLTRHSVTSPYFFPQLSGMDSNGDSRVLNSMGSAHLTHPKLPLGVENVLHCSLPSCNERVSAPPNGWIPQSLSSMRSTQDFEALTCEDTFIIQGKGLNYVINQGRDRSREHKKGYCNDISIGIQQEKDAELDGRYSRGISALNCENGHSPRVYFPLLQPPKYNSLEEVQGYIYFIAKDQHGCRFLQRKFEEGTPQDVKMIFDEIIDHVVELMMNPFGNYLMQKLLDVCNEEQRMHILLMVTEEPGQLVKISLNTHGTRAVQKLIETLKTRQQILLVISALELGFLDLIKDLNGNHVVQRCLQCLSNEDNKFIFNAAAKFCVDIATHRHGCCVLQRCIAHSIGEHRENLVAEISANGLLLAQDAFGNYVIQYILELKIPSATAKLISQFEGSYVQLSTQKFSSNVIEKCLKVFGEESLSRIIQELLSASQFDRLLHDPFANYVIQSALGVTKGPLHASLVAAIQPHAALLRTSPYCKRIFSRALLKK